jgi:Lipocalin-like domain
MKKTWMIFKFSNVVALGVAATFISGAFSPAHAQTAKDLVGTWQHVANVNIATDGKRTDTFGPDPKGMAIFTADGRFMIINLRNDLPKFAANSRVQGTSEENAAIVRGSIALYGTYSVADKTVSMKIDASTYPNWSGTESKRNILIFTGDEMKWSLAASIGGQSQSEVTWKRMK